MHVNQFGGVIGDQPLRERDEARLRGDRARTAVDDEVARGIDLRKCGAGVVIPQTGRDGRRERLDLEAGDKITQLGDEHEVRVGLLHGERGPAGIETQVYGSQAVPTDGRGKFAGPRDERPLIPPLVEQPRRERREIRRHEAVPPGDREVIVRTTSADVTPLRPQPPPRQPGAAASPCGAATVRRRVEGRAASAWSNLSGGAWRRSRLPSRDARQGARERERGVHRGQ